MRRSEAVPKKAAVEQDLRLLMQTHAQTDPGFEVRCGDGDLKKSRLGRLQVGSPKFLTVT